ncbi:MAG: hypothetical protein KKA60_13230 [Proteobacteria bacterium]|nr:hypothetical protein [Pseudomonadota bacterium]
MKPVIMKIFKAIAIVCLLLFLGMSFYILYSIYAPRPPCPANWSRIKAGMSRNAAIKKVPGDWSNLKDLKGFDSLVYISDEQNYWQLLLHYDGNNAYKTVKLITVSFINRKNGLRNLIVVNPDASFYARYAY